MTQIPPAPVTDRIAYKVMTVAEWDHWRRTGTFHGSAADIADGFIHLSCASQLAATLDKHYAGTTGLMLAAIDLASLGRSVRWEPSRGGELFPHIHGPLETTAVLAFEPLVRHPDGTVNLPAPSRG